jgi:hypothetical protein
VKGSHSEATGTAWPAGYVKPAPMTSRLSGVVGITVIGAALVWLAIAADQRWLDRHVLPSFYLPRHWYLLFYVVGRWSVVILGGVLVFAAPRLAACLSSRTMLRMLPVALSALLALGMSELVLRQVHLHPGEWLRPEEEPRREADSRLGWTLVPSRIGRNTVSGRAIEYAIDAAGYRVRRIDEPVDPTRPTVVFIGESMMFGEGLAWDESIPAQVGSILHVQSANLAVHGFSSDQAYLRLERELPHFHQPIAVVSLFMPALFGRDLDDDRPHLGPGLVWQPAVQHARLLSLAGLLVPYRRNETVERGIGMTRAVLGAISALAHSREATSLTLVPQFGVEEPVEEMVRRRILDDTGLPYTRVEMDSAWRLPWDRHPNTWAAHVMATAVAERLRLLDTRLRVQ